MRGIGHGVNTLGSMGAGIAVEFRRRWPAMYQVYVEECRSGRLQPGGIFVYHTPDRLIVNMATQQRLGRGSVEWVRAAARQVARCARGLGLPPVGAGLRGLRWAVVAVILHEELAPLAYVDLWSL